MNFEEKVWSLVDRQGPMDDGGIRCWEWRGGRSNGGYGQVWKDGRHEKAHRVVYELMVGPIPGDLTIDHLCRNRGCVNPSHLDPVPMRVNILRGEAPPAINARKTHCIRGHPFAVTKRGRVCRTCTNERVRRSHLHPRGYFNSQKTHCPRGHPYSGTNLKLNKSSGRQCRICANAGTAARKARLRALGLA